MATISDIRAGIAANLAPLAPDAQVSAYMLDAPTAPCVYVYPAQIDYDQAMHRGLDRLLFTVRAAVQPSLDRGGQASLDEYLAPSGAKSVKALIESDVTLAGLVAGLRVVACSGYKKFLPEQAQGPILLGAEWTIEVFASGL